MVGRKGRRGLGTALPRPDQRLAMLDATKPPSRLAGTDRAAVWLLPTPQTPAGVNLHQASTGGGGL